MIWLKVHFFMYSLNVLATKKLDYKQMQELKKDLRWKIERYSNNHTSSSLTWQSFPQYNNLWCTIEHDGSGPRLTLSNDSSILENISLSKSFLKDSRLSASFKAMMVGFKYMNETSAQRIHRFQVKFTSVQDFEAFVTVLQNYIPCTLAPTKSASPTKASASFSSLQMSYSQSSQTQPHDTSAFPLLEQQQELNTQRKPLYANLPTSELHYLQCNDIRNNSTEVTSSIKNDTRPSSLSEIDFSLLSDEVLTTWIDEAIADPQFLSFVKRVEAIWATRPSNGLK